MSLTANLKEELIGIREYKEQRRKDNTHNDTIIYDTFIVNLLKIFLD